jgi:hypothetical protein
MCFWRLIYISTDRPSIGVPIAVFTVPMMLNVFPLLITEATEVISVIVDSCEEPGAGVVAMGGVVVVDVVAVVVGVE